MTVNLAFFSWALISVVAIGGSEKGRFGDVIVYVPLQCQNKYYIFLNKRNDKFTNVRIIN